MTAWKPQTMRKLFTDLVPEEIAEAYEKLLDIEGVPEPETAAFFGDKAIAGELHALGMATLFTPVSGRPPVLEAVDPDLALPAVIQGLQIRSLDLQRRALEGSRRAREAGSLRTAGTTSRVADILTDSDEISRVSAGVVNEATADFMELDNFYREQATSVEWIVNPPAATADRVRHRTIYDQAYMQDPVGRKGIEAAIAAGHEVRWRPVVHAKMQIADARMALVALSTTGLSAALLLRSGPALNGFRENFEFLWDSSIPIIGPSLKATADLTPEQQEILSLLSVGLSQDRIADRMGKSTATVRRHLTGLYDELGVTTLFQAGSEARRRHWIS